MSDPKKKLDVSLDFGDVAGGTETKEKIRTPVVEDKGTAVEAKKDEATEKLETKSAIDVFAGNIIQLPITTFDEAGKPNGYKLKQIEHITGKEFLVWVREVMPWIPDRVMPIETEYDGDKEGLTKRKKTFANVAKKHEDMLRRGLESQKINLDKLIH